MKKFWPIILLIILIIGALNFTGFCYSKVRYLSEQDRLNIVAEYAISNSEIEYKSAKDFLEQSSLLKNNMLLENPSQFFLRIFRTYKSHIKLVYKKSNVGKYQYFREVIIQDSCGRIVDSVEGIETAKPQ